MAVTETTEPEKWLSYAQDRKVENPRYSVAAFRRDIVVARFTNGIADAKEAQAFGNDAARLDTWACPWIKLFCTYSGKPAPVRDCDDCEFKTGTFHETRPVQVER